MKATNKDSLVNVLQVPEYNEEKILESLPMDLFEIVLPGDTVVLKPNWVMECHKYRLDDWDYIITHPTIITCVLSRVLPRLNRTGRVVIIDGPATEASFKKLIARYPVERWRKMASDAAVELEIIDLREDEWLSENEVIVERHKLLGDPRGKVEVDLLGELSEFFGHRSSRRGYYGADYDISETNRAHDGYHNLYRVSRTVIESTVFINLAKLKTHRKAGITCCLKNLVGINTYKNFLPHHSEGGPSECGDQYPSDNANARIEGPLMGILKQHVLRHPILARLLGPFNSLGRRVFGDTTRIIRSGNWHGNDTIWRMILDLNKVLFYASPNGDLSKEELRSRKRYIGIVDAILIGEGNGPLAPERVKMGYILCGTNPAAIDAGAATLMSFEPAKIPSIARAFEIKRYPIASGSLDEVRLLIEGREFCLKELPSKYKVPCDPHFGWKGHIEENARVASTAG